MLALVTSASVHRSGEGDMSDHEVRQEPQTSHRTCEGGRGQVFRSFQPCAVFQTSAVLRASRLPLLRSAAQTVAAAYSEVKGRYPLLGVMGGVAEISVRQISQVAMRQATPLLQSLEPQSTWSCCG